MRKKLKAQKGKSKTSKGRNQLGGVRVIQRNIVYVVGLPLNFKDDYLLQRKEYFGQHGKVQISRTATDAIQQFPHSTCSVYFLYSEKEKAVRFIQIVHGFALDGLALALQNTVIHGCDMRSTIQQVTGYSNTMQRPGDEYCHNSSTSSENPVVKTAIATNIMAPIWKGKAAEAKVLAEPMSTVASRLRSSLIESNSQGLLSGCTLLLAANPERTELFNQACFGRPVITYYCREG